MAEYYTGSSGGYKGQSGQPGVSTSAIIQRIRQQQARAAEVKALKMKMWTSIGAGGLKFDKTLRDYQLAKTQDPSLGLGKFMMNPTVGGALKKKAADQIIQGNLEVPGFFNVKRWNPATWGKNSDPVATNKKKDVIEKAVDPTTVSKDGSNEFGTFDKNGNMISNAKGQEVDENGNIKQLSLKSDPSNELAQLKPVDEFEPGIDSNEPLGPVPGRQSEEVESLQPIGETTGDATTVVDQEEVQTDFMETFTDQPPIEGMNLGTTFDRDLPPVQKNRLVYPSMRGKTLEDLKKVDETDVPLSGRNIDTVGTDIDKAMSDAGLGLSDSGVVPTGELSLRNAFKLKDSGFDPNKFPAPTDTPGDAALPYDTPGDAAIPYDTPGDAATVEIPKPPPLSKKELEEAKSLGMNITDSDGNIVDTIDPKEKSGLVGAYQRGVKGGKSGYEFYDQDELPALTGDQIAKNKTLATELTDRTGKVIGSVPGSENEYQETIDLMKKQYPLPGGDKDGSVNPETILERQGEKNKLLKEAELDEIDKALEKGFNEPLPKGGPMIADANISAESIKDAAVPDASELGESIPDATKEVGKGILGTGADVLGGLGNIATLADDELGLEDAKAAASLAKSGAEVLGKEAIGKGIGKAMPVINVAMAAKTLTDKDSTDAQKAGAIMSTAGAVAATNFWNPAGWVAGALTVGGTLLTLFGGKKAKRSTRAATGYTGGTGARYRQSSGRY